MTPVILDHLRFVGSLLVSLLLAGFAVVRLSRLRIPVFRRQKVAGVSRLPDPESKLRQQVAYLVELRWIVIGTILVMAILAVPGTQVLPVVSLFLLAGWWLLLTAVNLLFGHWIRSGPNPERQLLVQLSADLVILTGLLNASGGIENPFHIAYIFPVAIAAILLPRRWAATVAVLAGLLLGSLAAGEAFHLLPHYTLELFPHPDPATELSPHAPEPPFFEPQHGAYDPSFVAGEVFPLLVVVLVTFYLGSLFRERLKESEDAVLRSAREILLEHRRLEGMVQAAGVGMMVIERGQKVQWFSRQMAEWFGWREDLEGGVCPFYRTEGGCGECVALGALEDGRVAEAERQVTRDGVRRYVRHVAQPVRGPDGRVLQVVELIDDVTRRKALEVEAVHAGKLSVLGHLAAGLAHEIGNPLASLSARLKRLERERDPTFLDESILLIQKQIERIDRTVRNVSLYSRKRPEEWTRCRVNEMVKEAVSLVRLDDRAHALRFELSLVEPSPAIRGVRDQIVQVLVNLLLNGVEAMPEGGVLCLESRLTGQGVELAVTDTGPGVPSEVMDRIFEPFVTTKSQGVGLGLAISRSLVQAHGGTLEGARLPDPGGTRFTVCLPVAEPAAAGPQLKGGV